MSMTFLIQNEKNDDEKESLLTLKEPPLKILTLSSTQKK